MKKQEQPDPAKAGTIAQQIVTILHNEDSETRWRAIQAAMALLGEPPVTNMSARSQLESYPSGDDDHVGLAAFFDRDEKLKPSDYACLCAAYHFSKYGIEAFALDDLRAIARDAGVVLPDRLDMTLKQASKKGKKLFLSAGRDAYKPTASAGMLFTERWGVKPGKRTKGAASVKA